MADVLERVLDRGVVIVGDIVVGLLGIELLTLKVRLLIASADSARQMGIDWWMNDPFLNSDARQRELDRQAAEERGDPQQRRQDGGSRALPGDGDPDARSAGGDPDALRVENERLRARLAELERRHAGPSGAGERG